MRSEGQISVRGHCVFRWRLEEGRRVIEREAQCDDCVEAMRVAAHVAGCHMSDDTAAHDAGGPQRV